MSNLTATAQRLAWRALGDTAVSLYRQHEPELREKKAESPFLRELANLWQLRPAQAGDVIPWNLHGPLSSMLVGGLAGAGLGYGGGWLAEKILPNRWRRGNLRRTLAVAGGGLGMAPGLLFGMANLAGNRNFNDNSTLRAGQSFKPLPGPEEVNRFLPPDNLQFEVTAAYEKQALLSGSGIVGAPLIDVNEFNQVIWHDPRVARPLSAAQQAAVSGLVTTAANLPGRLSPRYVTPMDIGRLTAGMGTGYLSGALVGKGLSLLMGMPEESQERLKNTGMWAGVVSALVPIAFGGQ